MHMYIAETSVKERMKGVVIFYFFIFYVLPWRSLICGESYSLAYIPYISMAVAWLTHATLEVYDHAAIFAHWHSIPGTFLSHHSSE